MSDYSYYADLATSVFVLGLVLVVWIIVSSILVLVGGARINSHPESHIRWGIVILLFSIIGLGLTVLFVPLWTGFLGIPITVLGIVGGILALAFKPSTPTPQAYGYQQPYPPQGYPPQQQAPYQQPYPPQQPYAQQAPQQIKRICPQCGRVVDENLRFCPNCGKSLA
ncbi:MAG: zinc ribbon domain-containing protein [Candidatus Bathyarchaeia archaeon]